jgi:hypothetical protein
MTTTYTAYDKAASAAMAIAARGARVPADYTPIDCPIDWVLLDLLCGRAHRTPFGVVVMKRILLIAALIGGCTTIDRQVVGWPQDMKITTHEDAGFVAVQRECFRDMPWYWRAAGGVTLQCATIDLRKHTCDLYTISGPVSEHEYQHCKGGDHDGIAQRNFDRWMTGLDEVIAKDTKLRHPLPAENVAAWRDDFAKRKENVLLTTTYGGSRIVLQ